MLNKEIKILLYSNGLWNFGEGMLGPLFAVFAQRIGGNILDISYAWAIYLIVLGILIIIVGRLSDGMDKTKLLVAGYFLNTFFTFGYLLVHQPAHLFIIQAGLGVGSALTIPTWMSLFSKYEEKARSGFVWGFAGGLARIAMGVAIVTGGFIVTYFSFNALFVTMGTIQLAASFWQARLLRMNENKHQ